jgi:NAD(P)-dependent dehydrogenase (short-subunit alcohol dehydrogenase family)
VKYNIVVNLVASSYTETDMVTKAPEDIQIQIKAKVPLGRYTKPEEIARAVLFFAADGDYITGQEININGEVYMWKQLPNACRIS